MKNAYLRAVLFFVYIFLSINGFSNGDQQHEIITESETKTFTSTDVPKTIPDNNSTGVTSSLTVSDNINIESLILNVNISHTYISDLEVILISPQGTSVTAHDHSGGADADIIQSYFLTEFNGENTIGTWTLWVIDSAPQDTGTINAWSLDIKYQNDSSPTTPGNLRVPVVSSGNLPLVWDASTDDSGISHYEVFNGSTKLDDTPSTYYYIRNLTPETQYTFKVRAVDTTGNMSDFASVTVTTAPDDNTPPTIPENFRGFFENTSDIKLYWSPSSDNIAVRYYAIYRGEDNSLVGTTSATNLLVSGVSHSTMHRFKIKAYDYEGNTSGFGPEAIVMPDNYDTEAPTVPQNCVGAGLSENTVRLAWNASSDNIGVRFYAIYKSEDNSLVGTTPYTSFVIRGLQQYVTYKYKIKAFDFADNRSGFSNEVQVRTLVPDDEPPTAPQNLQAAGASATSIRLTWEPATDNIGVRYYAVYKYENNALLGTSYTTEFTLDGLDTDTEYSFRIKAFDFNGNKSPFSNKASSETLRADNTPPTAPANLIATPVSETEIKLTWNPSTDDQGVKLYAIYQGDSNTLVGTTPYTQYTVSGLEQNVEYTFRIKAFDFNNNRSGFSNDATAQTYGDLNIYKTALYIPRILHDESWETTIGIVNPHEENVEFSMIAFKSDGSYLQAATYTLIKRRKISQRIGLWFRNIDDLSQVAWVFIGSPQQLQGYAEYTALSGEATMLTEALMSKTDFLTTPYIPEDLNADWGQLGVVNMYANQSVGYDSGDIGYSGIPGLSSTNSQSTTPLKEYFSENADTEKKFGSVTSSEKAIAAFQMTGSTTGEQASAFTLKGAPTSNLYYLMGDNSHGDWQGVLYNASSLDAEIHVIAYNAYGSKLTENTFNLSGKTVMKGDLGEFVTASNVSHIVISSDRNIYGAETITNTFKENCAGLSAGYQVSDELYFNNIKLDADHITELALANFGDESNSVTLYCYDVNGNVAVWGRVALRGHQKMTGTLSELLEMEIPETVTRVKALGYQPMAGIAIISNTEGTTLSTMMAHPGNYETVEVSLGTEGGTVSNGDTTVTIPQGALTTDTSITLSETPADTHSDGATEILSSTSYSLEPSGLELEEPIQVSIPVDGSILQQIENGELTEEDLALVAWNIDLEVWEEIDNSTFSKTNTGERTEFFTGFLSGGITSLTTFAVAQKEDTKDISLTINFSGYTNKFLNKPGCLVIKREPDFGLIETFLSTDTRYDFYIKYFQNAANGIEDDDTLMMLHVNNLNSQSWDSSDSDMYKRIKKYQGKDLWCFFIPDNGPYTTFEESCYNAYEITFWTMTFSELEFDHEIHKIVDVLIPGQINTYTTSNIKNGESNRSYFPGKTHYNSIALDRTAGSSTAKNPVLLIHGINGTSNAWGENPERLRQKGYEVWVATLNGCGIEDIPKTAEEIKYAVEYMSNEYDREIDVVTHSYGGVTTRYYFLNPDNNASWNAYSEVDTLVMVGPPHHGSLAADRCYNKEDLVLIERLGYLGHRTLDINAPIYKELTPGSENLMKMGNNSFEDGVTPIVFAGIKNNLPGINKEALYEFDDFVVSVASASLLNCEKPVPLGIIDYTHTSQPSSEKLFDAITLYLDSHTILDSEILQSYARQSNIDSYPNDPTGYNPFQGILIVDTSGISDDSSITINPQWSLDSSLEWRTHELAFHTENNNCFYTRNNIRRTIKNDHNTVSFPSGLSLDLGGNQSGIVDIDIDGNTYEVEMLAGCTTIFPNSNEMPHIQLNPSELSVSCIEGETAASTSFTIKNSGSGTVNYTVSDNQTWIQCTPISGSATTETDTIAVTFNNTESLIAGNHTGTITVSDSNASNSPQTITVNLTVNEPAQEPTISLNKSTITQTITEGETAASTSFTVRNSGSGTLNYSVTDNQPWIQSNPTSGTATTETDTIAVTFNNTASLSAGSYSGTISVSDSNASNSPRTITVYLTVNAPAQEPTILLDKSTITQTITEGETAASTSFTVRNSGTGTLNYTVTDNQPWIQCSPTSGTTTTETDTINVTFNNTASLSAGSYTGTISVTDSNATNSPRTITVYLTVEESHIITGAMSVSVIMDSSGSMTETQFAEEKNAAIHYATFLENQDEMAIYNFSTTNHQIKDFTSDRNTMIQSISGTEYFGGSTLLYDSMIEAMELGKNQEGTKVIFVMTDGGDTISSNSAEDVVDKALAEDFVIYALYFDTSASKNKSQDISIINNNATLQWIAEQTGGLYYSTGSSAETFEEVMTLYQESTGRSVPEQDFEIVAFYANPDHLDSSGSITLGWVVTGSDSVFIDQGIGNVLSVGSLSQGIDETKIYTLTATNGSDTLTRTLIITYGDDVLSGMVLIPSGTFQMGSNSGSYYEQPVHPVSINSFFLSQYEITTEQYVEFLNSVVTVESNWFGEDTAFPSSQIHNINGDYYVEQGYETAPASVITWLGAVAYCEWLSDTTGETYYLPSEAEWEYACRAGSTTEYYWGDSWDDAFGWCSNNSSDRYHPVGEKLPNDFGLYDMSGNVYEWCADYYNTSAYSNISSYTTNPSGNPVYNIPSSTVVARGGAYGSSETSCRSAYRAGGSPSSIYTNTGFRVARAINGTVDQPAIQLSTHSVSVSCTEGQTPPSMTFTIRNSGIGTLNYSISEGISWLSCSPYSGTCSTETDTITIVFNTASMSPGTVVGAITVSDTNASNNPQIINVSLTIDAEEQPTISISSSSISNTCEAGQNAPDKTFTVTNSGIGTLNYTISDNVSWITCTPTSGISTNDTDTITVKFYTSSLENGTYSGTITVADANASNSPQTISVTLQVGGTPQTNLYPVSFGLNNCNNVGNNAPDKQLYLLNTGNGTIDYEISDNADWLRFDTTSGTLSNKLEIINVYYDTSSLAPGNYSAQIDIYNTHNTSERRSITLRNKVYPFNAVELQQLGQTGSGNYREVYKKNNTLYCMTGNGGIDVIDVSDFSNPLLIRKVETLSNTEALLFKNNMMYGLGTSLLTVFDNTDTTNPLIKDYYTVADPTNEENEFVDFEISNNYLFIATFYSIVVLDISNPDNLIKVNEITLSNSSHIRELFLLNNTLFALNNAGEIIVLDIVSIYEINQLTKINTGLSYCNNLYIRGSYVFITGEDGLTVMDISNLNSPITTGSYFSYYPMDNLVVDENYFAYINSWGSQTQILDVANPYYPYNITTVDTSLYPFGLLFDSDLDYLLIGDNFEGLKVFDVNNISTPQLISSFDQSAYLENIVVDGNYAYILDYEEGLQIFNIGNSANPTLISKYDTEDDPKGLAVNGNVCYTTDWDNGFQVINISNPSSPVLVSNYSEKKVYGEIAVSGNYAYIANDEYGLDILNISNPNQINWVNNISFTEWIEKITINNDTLIVSYWNYENSYGIRVMNISNGSSPVVQSDINVDGYIRDIYVYNNYIYMTNREKILIYDISNPYNPIYINEINFSVNNDVWLDFESCCVINDYLFTLIENGVRVYDISNPYDPQDIGFYESLIDNGQIIVYNNKLYLTSGHTGKFMIYDIFQ